MESEDYSIIGKTVSSVIRETRYPREGNAYQAVVRVEFEDGGVMLESGEVIPPKPGPSVIDRLMAGEAIRAEVEYGVGRYTPNELWELVGAGLDSRGFHLDIFDSVIAVHPDSGEDFDLDELRRRVAKREIERMSKWVTPVKPKPDMALEWWVIAEHGTPDLEPDTIYVYDYTRDGRRHWRAGADFIVDGSKLLDSDGDLVRRIKEAK